MRPIGSEKITDAEEKLKRILEIAGITQSSRINPQQRTNGRPASILHEAVGADGEQYAIVQEERHVYIKKKVNESYEYMTGVSNIKEFSYKTYADALKQLNLYFKEINARNNVREGSEILKKKV